MLTSLIGTANGFLWGMPMLIVIGAGGIFLTVYLGFPQFKHFGDAWKRILDKGDPTKTGGFHHSHPSVQQWLCALVQVT